MSSKGLNKEIIVANAVEYIEKTGNSSVSMHELARRLGIKTPSLYNHVKNTIELQYEILKYAINKFVDHQKKAVQGKTKDEAVKSFAKAYHDFATHNKGLYRLIMSIPSEKDEKAKEIAVPLLNTVVEMLKDYGLNEGSIAHWQRVFRAILHGFISQEELGYFYYYDDIELDKSRDVAVQCYLVGLHNYIENNK